MQLAIWPMSTYTFNMHDMQESEHTLYTVNFREYQCRYTGQV